MQLGTYLWVIFSKIDDSQVIRMPLQARPTLYHLEDNSARRPPGRQSNPEQLNSRHLSSLNVTHSCVATFVEPQLLRHSEGREPGRSTQWSPVLGRSLRISLPPAACRSSQGVRQKHGIKTTTTSMEAREIHDLVGRILGQQLRTSNQKKENLVSRWPKNSEGKKLVLPQPEDQLAKS